MGWFSGKQQTSLDILAERQRRTEEEMTAIAKTVGEIHTALVVRDPGTRLSAEAYDGLRKTVIAGASQRRAHLVQLVELSNALNRGADTAQLISMVDEWLVQAGLAQVRDARRPELYEVLGGTGDGLHVLTAAWVDSQNGALIRRGTAERVQMPPRSLPRVPPHAAVPPAPAPELPHPTTPPAPDPQAPAETDAPTPGAVADAELSAGATSGDDEPPADELAEPMPPAATPHASAPEPSEEVVSVAPAETPTVDTPQQPVPTETPFPEKTDKANGSDS